MSNRFKVYKKKNQNYVRRYFIVLIVNLTDITYWSGISIVNVK